MSTRSSIGDSIGTVARLRHVRTSPTKVRPVLKLIQGQDVATARDTLTLCERAIASELEKLLDSAIANAEHNDNVPADELFVARAYADEGPTAKRWRPRARHAHPQAHEPHHDHRCPLRRRRAGPPPTRRVGERRDARPPDAPSPAAS
jgi:large subunit ribosomal protein L22